MTEIQQPPLFEDVQPNGCKVKLTGKIGTPFRAIRRGEDVYLIIKGHVTHVDHGPDGKEGPLVRFHTVESDEVHELPMEQGEMALLEGQQWTRKVQEALSGQTNMFDQGEADEG